jgi:DNA repair exonuclease SbcCD nuclease subunit
MKLIHTADLHLDSAMEARLSPEKARLRKKELLLCFGAIADLAEREGARVVLLSGDIFDTDHPAASSVRYLLDTVKAHSGIDFLMLYGNHSANYRLDGDLPDNLRFFGEHEYTLYRYGNVVICGSEDTSAELPPLAKEDLNIVTLPGQVVPHRHGDGEIGLSELCDKGIDYLALGHIHAPRIEKLDSRGFYCYPGCPEGRGFDEIGERGVVLLDTDGERLKKSFLPIARRTLHDISIDVSAAESQHEIEAIVLREIAEVRESDLLRIRLVGARSAHLLPDVLQLSASLEGNHFHVEIKNETVVKIDPSEYENDLSLRGEFVRTVLALALPKEEEGLILSAGLAVLSGEEVPF